MPAVAVLAAEVLAVAAIGTPVAGATGTAVGGATGVLATVGGLYFKSSKCIRSII